MCIRDSYRIEAITVRGDEQDRREQTILVLFLAGTVVAVVELCLSDDGGKMLGAAIDLDEVSVFEVANSDGQVEIWPKRGPSRSAAEYPPTTRFSLPRDQVTTTFSSCGRDLDDEIGDGQSVLNEKWT